MRKVVIYVGRLVSYKGVPLLLEVWQRVQQMADDVRLVLVGSGGMDIHNCEAALQTYVEANALQQSVYFTGDVKNVDEYIQASDLFVLPTENEAFGISVIEAHGLRIASDWNGGWWHQRHPARWRQRSGCKPRRRPST